MRLSSYCLVAVSVAGCVSADDAEVDDRVSGDAVDTIDGTALATALCAYADRCKAGLGAVAASAAECQSWISVDLGGCNGLAIRNTREELDACVA